MDFSLTTPALLFPAISLLLLAYTNRFLALASLVRELKGRWERKPDPGIPAQIANLKVRIRLIKRMQLLGVACFFLSVLTMLLLASLALSLRELSISADALDILLDGERERADCPEA